jgi:Tfp pilus assembly protein PilF
MVLDTGQLPLSGEPLLWFRQGLAEVENQAYESAIQRFDQVLAAVPDCVEVWYERGLTLETWGYYGDAVASFDRALALRPTSTVAASVWHDRGNALQYGLGDYLGAIACYDQALIANPSHNLALQNRGNALLYGLSRPEEALKYYEKSLQLDPSYALGWRNRGNALVELRRYTEAMVSYDRALKLDPEDDVAWHARTLASSRLGLNAESGTTRRAWQTSGFEDDTFIEDDQADERISAGETFIPLEPGAERPLEMPPILPPLPRLLVEDDRGVREVVLDEACYVIGRDSRCQICLHSQFVSRQHAVLRVIPQTEGRPPLFEILDGTLDGQPSTNGLLVNGQKLRSRLLKPNDVIVFGPKVQATFYLER